MLRSNIATPLYLQLYREIISAIDAGKLTSGCSLPSERQMAELHGVSRITARRAYTLLEESGYTVSIQGKGTYVL